MKTAESAKAPLQERDVVAAPALSVSALAIAVLLGACALGTWALVSAPGHAFTDTRLPSIDPRSTVTLQSLFGPPPLTVPDDGGGEARDTFGWVDQSSGVIRMPIDRAMRVLVEEGHVR
jgi:hypothetical protein